MKNDNDVSLNSQMVYNFQENKTLFTDCGVVSKVVKVANQL